MPQAFMVSDPRSLSLRAINYYPALEHLRRRRSIRLGCLPCKVTDSFGDIFTAHLCDPGHGIQLLSQVDTFAAEPSGKWIQQESMRRPEVHRFNKWQIAMAGAGQMAEGNLFGRSILVDDRFADLFVASDSIILEFEDPGSDMNLWTYAYLNTQTGLQTVRSCAYGTSIPRLRLDLLQEIPIPLADETVTQRVAELIRRCVTMRESYLRELHAARNVVERLPEMREAHTMCAERKARTVEWVGSMPTLCAWNYASPGEALALLLKKWSGRICDLVPKEGLFRGGRYQRIPCERPFGIDFLNQRDVFSIRPAPRRIVAPAVPKDWFIVPKFSLLAGGQGTLGEGELFGRVAVVSADLATAGVSEHLLRIQPIDRKATATLYAFLSTLVGRRVLRSTGVGTKLLSLRPDLVLALPVPELAPELVSKVVKHLEAACAARVAAATAEVEAIRVLDEEVLPSWLA
jgi:hypothetical protein